MTAGSEPMPSVPVTMDTKGRVRTSSEQRGDILAVFERSGVFAAECAKQGKNKVEELASDQFNIKRRVQLIAWHEKGVGS